MEESGTISRLLLESSKTALKYNSPEIKPEHIVLAIIEDANNSAYKLLKGLDLPIENIRYAIVKKLNNQLDVNNHVTTFRTIEFSSEVQDIMARAITDANSKKDKITDSSEILLAMTNDNAHFIYQIFNEMNLSYDDIIRNAKNIRISPESGFGTNEEEDDDDIMDDNSQNNKSDTASSSKENAQNSGSATPILDKYGIDMTKAATENKLDPVIGREKEIERLAQILSRRKKNNPVLIGEPGVGKSAIVEGLALRIIQRKVSRVLFDKRIVSLDMASIVAGTKFRGQFEERIKAILDELSTHPEIILFIDEIHTIVGAGNSTGSMDAANMLKPALARGTIQCIGATTLDEYRKNIEKDGALERRFQKIIVDATTPEETLQILNNIKVKYEDHHNVRYTDEAIQACVRLTERYISERNFPDKAIDALDEAGSRVHITSIVVPKEIEEIEKKIAETAKNKIKAARSQNFESAANYRDMEQKLMTELQASKESWEKELEKQREVVDADKIAEVVAMMTGVPVERIATEEGLRLLQMDNELKQQIIGQDNAITKITKAIRRNRVGLKDPNRPIGTFMFLGPTGVGKTYLAKKLAEFLFNSPDSLIRLDMSEFMEKFTVSRLVGAPPGYVGYDEGGQLTEKVRRHPYSVVLLDEIEKAHSDVFNMLLQVLDEGRLTDSNGRHVDFKNTILIMTSNVGSRELKDFGKGVGFNTSSRGKEYSDSVLTKALNKTFSPEFINRIDDIIMFDSLDKDAMNKIIEVELSGFYKRISELGYNLVITNTAKEFIVSKGFDPQYGARPLKRAIQQYIEDELAEVILSQNGNVISNCSIVIDFDKKSQKIVSKIKKETTKQSKDTQE